MGGRQEERGRERGARGGKTQALVFWGLTVRWGLVNLKHLEQHLKENTAQPGPPLPPPPCD